MIPPKGGRPSNTHISCERRRPLPLEDARIRASESWPVARNLLVGWRPITSALVSFMWLLDGARNVNLVEA